ncbi:MAG: ribosome recycling factor [Nitrospinae bacterium]|nr:ribosome recycling factor [Nitrospinota bacterium]
MIQKVYDDLERKMTNSINAFKRELNSIRTGKASLALLEGIYVEYYGNPTPLNQLGTLSIPEIRLIIIQPWDTSMITNIEKAILTSDLGLVPSNDGRIIRIPIPPLTEERRKQLVKIVKKSAEDCKVIIRNIRREANEIMRSLEKEKKISEDDLHRAQDRVQKSTDKFIKEVEDIFTKKEKEVLEV